MSILEQLNSPVLYAICGGIIAFVALICVVFLVRAYRVGLQLGMDRAKLRRVIISSATFSVLPSVGILLGVIALAGSLGIPWPWLRLSVIGALHYEAQAAQVAAEQVGMKTLSAAEMTPSGFSTIALLMSVCIMWGMLMSIFFNKKYSEKLTTSAAGKHMGFADQAMTAMFIGLVSAYLGSYLGDFISGEGLLQFRGDWMPLLVAAVSAIVMGGLTVLSEKKHMDWIENFSTALSMLLAMAAAVVVGLAV